MSDPITITSFALGLLDRIIKFFVWVRGKLFPEGSPERPGRLAFVHARLRRSKGGWRDRPGMQLIVDRWVTNTYAVPVHLLRGELVYWQGFRRKRVSQTQIEGSTPIQAGTTLEVRVHFMVVPPPVSEHKAFKAKVSIIDQFNRRHKAGTFRFETNRRPLGPD
jgi:hypothetical protein